MDQMKCEACVIGSGPAGLTAALYLRRAKVDTLIVSGKMHSAMSYAHQIENYPGIKAIGGKDLLKSMQSQVEDLDVRFLKDEVIALMLDMDPKMISTKNAIISADVVIIAIGKGARKPELEREEEFIGKGVSYCAVCDGPLYRDRDVVLLGMDDEAAEESLVLDQMGCRVTWVLKEKSLEDTSISAEKISEIRESGIPIVEDATNLKVLDDEGKVSGIQLEDGSGVEEKIDASCIFVLTSIPTARLLQRAGVHVSERNTVITNEIQETNVEGVYACGDICGKGYQVSIAVGEGAVAGLQAAKKIRKLRKQPSEK